jgi:hypothetical protein
MLMALLLLLLNHLIFTCPSLSAAHARLPPPLSLVSIQLFYIFVKAVTR